MDVDRPTMIYDGECGFCRRWIARWWRWTGERVAYATSQQAATDFPHIPAQRFRESVVLVEPGGRVTFAAEAVMRSLAVRAAGRMPLWIYEHVPGARAVSEAAYRTVARRRGRRPIA
jgi:predicted DCC family thiol-disulfide oxidoreductase YuxK